MRILCLEQFSELGGGQRNLLDLLPAFRERGWSALVAAPGSGPLFEFARAAGAETAKIKLGSYSDPARFVRDTIQLRAWIAHQSWDLISVGGARPLVAVATGARGRPVIFQALHFLGKPSAVKVAGWAIRHARMTVVANAEHVAAQFRRYVPADRLHIVYQGVPEIPFAAREFGRKWRIGLIGRIAPMKGQTDFLRAAAVLAPMLPDARFVICGTPMFSPASYIEEVRRLSVGLPVDFLGWREDIDAVLADLDLLVVPSTAAEATTRVILEAFSAGVPVVAYAIGGIPEIVRDGDNGFLIPECNSQALAQKIFEVTKLDLGPIVAGARGDWEHNYNVARYRQEMIEVMELTKQMQVTSASRATT
jgi:glycosyltransferase involved in cell wall biosynthesis